MELIHTQPILAQHAACNTYTYIHANKHIIVFVYFTPCPCASIWRADYTGFQDFHLICSVFNEKLFSNQLFALTFRPNNDTNACVVAMSFWQDQHRLWQCVQARIATVRYHMYVCLYVCMCM